MDKPIVQYMDIMIDDNVTIIISCFRTLIWVSWVYKL